MERKLDIIVCYVGFGDCIHITLPDGCQLLVDTGRSRYFEEIAKFLEKKNKKIDYILITHDHSDHMNGLIKFIERFNVKAIIWWFDQNSKLSPTDLYIGARIYRKLINRSIVAYSIHDARNNIDSFNRYIDILYPIDELTNPFTEDRNRNSIVFLIKFCGKQLIFTGDATYKEEKKILNQSGIDITNTIFIKIGHHGSDTSTSSDLLKNMVPDNIKGVACSCSEKRLRKPPSQKKLEEIEDHFSCFKCTGESSGLKRHLIFTVAENEEVLSYTWRTENV